MSNENADNKAFEQQKTEIQKSSLENQVEGNYKEDSKAAAERIAENAEEANGNK